MIENLAVVDVFERPEDEERVGYQLEDQHDDVESFELEHALELLVC